MKRLIIYVAISSLIATSCGPGQPVKNNAASNIKFAPIKVRDSYSRGNHISNTSFNIMTVKDNGFRFLLEAVNGGNDYQVEGFANYTNDSEAFYQEEKESVTFTFRHGSVFVSEHGSGGSVGIEFNGEYSKGMVMPNEKDDTGDIACLDAVPNRNLKTAAGAHYQNIADCMNKYSEDEVVEDTTRYKVYSGGMEGVFTIYEAVILSRGDFYYAGLVLNDTIHLYTNDPAYSTNKEKLPKTIQEWIPKMTHKKVVYYY